MGRPLWISLLSSNPRVAGLHLKGLLEAEWIDRFLFQILNEASSADIAETVRQAVAIFMRAYGPETGASTAQTPV